jgi:hypothetical protein
MAEVMLSTTDNPYNPFTEFDQWYAFDTQVGHHTLALLGRVCITSDELSELDQSRAIDHAMDEIVAENASGIHLLVSADTAISL